MAGSISYLSDEWLAEADAAVKPLTPLDRQLVVTINVNGGPASSYRYHVVLGPDQVGFLPAGRVPSAETIEPQVSMTMAWEVAVGVAQGTIGAQRAFLDGAIQLGGDVTLLLGHQEALAAVDDRLADLRARTNFET